MKIKEAGVGGVQGGWGGVGWFDGGTDQKQSLAIRKGHYSVYYNEKEVYRGGGGGEEVVGGFFR